MIKYFIVEVVNICFLDLIVKMIMEVIIIIKFVIEIVFVMVIWFIWNI